MQAAQDSHLATITPIDTDEAKRIMNFPSLLTHNLVFVALQTGWIWLTLVGWYFFTSWQLYSTSNSLGIVLLMMSLLWLMTQFVIVFIYPEWPMNRMLSSRLRRVVANRSDRPTWAADVDLRVVELVPRERWNKMLLDTATDLLLLRIDHSGLSMEGDCDRYVLPAESILGVELKSVRPSGWFTDTHMVIIYARTKNGPVELPISFRDHQFGCLRNLRRREQAMELVDRINGIAKGHHYNPVTLPADYGWDQPHASPNSPSLGGLHDGTSSGTMAAAGSMADANPYAPPMIQRDERQ